MEFEKGPLKIFKIYVLKDGSENIFYVGCTTETIQKRFYAHINGAKSKIKKGVELNDLQKKIVEENFNVTIEVVDILEDHTWGNANGTMLENKWIVKLTGEGCNLLNKTNTSDRQPDYIGKTIKAA